MSIGDSEPTVSVCIPAYRGAAFLTATIESVLDQTLDDLEVIVLDDASPDGTADIVGRFADTRLRYERNDTRLGVEGNWNRVLSQARGRYVKVLCHDDLLRPDCLACQVAVMESHPEVALVAGRRDVVDEAGRVLVRGRGLRGLSGVVRPSTAIRQTVRTGTNMFGEPLAVLLRRDLTAQCGPFSGRRPYVIDLDYWCRMLRFGSLYAQPETVGAFRVTSTSLSVELMRQQSRQTVGFLKELRQEHETIVTGRDVAVGVARGMALAAARAAGYRLLQRRRRS